MKQLHYNEYGALIESNPKWCNMVGFIFNQVGNAFYHLKLRGVAFFFWGEAYGWYDLQCYSRIKGYTPYRAKRGKG